MFHIWNNGRSVFNLDHIVRIRVFESEHSTISRYRILTTPGIEIDIEREEYQKIMNKISGEEK